MKNEILRIKKLYHEMHTAQVIAFHAMTDNEYVNDNTRAAKTIEEVQRHMARQGMPVPLGWENQLERALDQYEYPPGHPRDAERTPSKSKN